MKMFEKKWVDLGLPSGTLWCDANEEGYYSWNEMINIFDKENLPKLTDFAELYDYCKWKWSDKRKGMIVTGANGNSIFMPASGFCNHNDNNLNVVNSSGYYWSKSPNDSFAYYLYFNYCDYIGPASYSPRKYGCSVRLIKRK
jgi:uncharacterized protein (TIGR02145 family)